MSVKGPARMDEDDLSQGLERFKRENNGRRIWAVGCCGIIGVGKSSALKRWSKTGLLQTILDSALGALTPQNKQTPLICFVPEPTKEWRAKGWLQTYYENQSEEAFWFQIQVFQSHVEAVEAVIAVAPPDRDLILIQERTMYDQRLFWEQQRTLGYRTATDRHHVTYMGIWQRWRRFVPEPSFLLLFETSSLQTTMQRVLARARAEEMGGSFSETELPLTGVDGAEIEKAAGVTLGYQENLLKLHHEWYSEPVAHPPSAAPEGIPCFGINADKPFHVDDAHLAALSYQVVSHILNVCLKK